MQVRVAINLRRRSLKNSSINPLGQAQAIDGSHNRSLDRLDGIVLVMDRGSWASQVVNTVYLNLEGVDNIMPHKLEIRGIQKMGNVSFGPGK